MLDLLCLIRPDWLLVCIYGTALRNDSGHIVWIDDVCLPTKVTVWVFNTNRVCHIWCNLWCNFWPGYMCWTTMIFGTQKDDSLEINCLALNNSFTYLSSKMASTLVKNGLKNNSKFCEVWTIWFFSNFISKHLRNIWRDLRLPISALATVAGKIYSKFTAKIDFQIGYFMLLLLLLTLEV